MHTILVTGASTGIGYTAALQLSKRATVFAGVRSDADLAKLGTVGPSVVALKLDVTDRDSIARAVAVVTERTGGTLDALVNNAGIVVAAPLEIVEPDQFEKQFSVNVMGPLYVTQAFLPLIRASKGRIVTIGSIAGKFSMPYAGPYAASKFAIEALTDSLRMEMAPWGIKVVLIEPGAIKTPLWQRGQTAGREALERMTPGHLELYGDPIAKMQRLSTKIESGAIAPEAVAAVIERALFTKSPRARYLVGTDARVQLAIGRLPERVRDGIIGSLLAKA